MPVSSLDGEIVLLAEVTVQYAATMIYVPVIEEVRSNFCTGPPQRFSTLNSLTPSHFGH